MYNLYDFLKLLILIIVNIFFIIFFIVLYNYINVNSIKIDVKELNRLALFEI
jgi:hypothetical protein